MLFLTLLSTLATSQTCQSADVMITLDISGTMSQTTGSPAKSKYARAKDAISSVLTAHQNEGSFGLYLFPEPAVAQTGGCHAGAGGQGIQPVWRMAQQYSAAGAGGFAGFAVLPGTILVPKRRCGIR